METEVCISTKKQQINIKIRQNLLEIMTIYKRNM